MRATGELLLLAVEGGATRTHWRVYATCGDKKKLIDEGFLGCGNWKTVPFSAMRALLRSLPKKCDILAVFLAGCTTGNDRSTLHSLCKEIWPSVQSITVGSDRDSGYSAAFEEEDGILVIAGTGSAVTGKRGKQIETAAGWGRLLGDPGSGFALSIQALRESLQRFDLTCTISPFLKSVFKKLDIHSVRELTDWAERAEKADLAELASVLFVHQAEPEIYEVLTSGANLLADCCAAVAHRLKEERPRVSLAGGIFTHHPEYIALFQKALHQRLPEADVTLSQKPGVEGAAWIALQHKEPSLTSDSHAAFGSTEEKNPRSHGWESLPTLKLVQLFVDEELCVQEALQEAAHSLARAIDSVTQRLSEGGRLFYVGAGTSGRLGVLDATEIPVTFGFPPEKIQGIMAGGTGALLRSAEEKEDDEKLAPLALQQQKLTSQDVVCALSASGTTPFVWGAIREAKRLGALSLLITCTNQPLPTGPDIEVRLFTGPELLAGSTRLKAGTATKVALNILSTGVMVRLGRVRDNSMAFLHPGNKKMRQRAIRILSETLRLSPAESLKKLEAAKWDLSTILSQIESQR